MILFAMRKGLRISRVWDPWEGAWETMPLGSLFGAFSVVVRSPILARFATSCQKNCQVMGWTDVNPISVDQAKRNIIRNRPSPLIAVLPYGDRLMSSFGMNPRRTTHKTHKKTARTTRSHTSLIHAQVKRGLLK